MTMNAFILRPTTSQPLRTPMAPPTASAISSETGRRQPLGRERDPHADAARAEQDAGDHGGERGDRFDREIHVAGDDDDSDSPIAMTPTKVDCSMMFTKMPIWKKLGMVSENTASTRRG